MAEHFPEVLDNQEAGDIIESADRNAIVFKIGINGSGETTSLDYLLKSTSSGDPGHLHTKVGTIATGVWNGTAIPVAYGGTGAATASAARTALGVAIGSDVLAYGANINSIAGLANNTGNFIVGTGSAWSAQGPYDARASLGLGASDDVEFDLITSSVESSSNAIDVTQGGTGSALKLDSDASNPGVLHITSEPLGDLNSQFLAMRPTMSGGGVEAGWYGLNIDLAMDGNTGNRNTGSMRGISMYVISGGGSTTGEILDDLIGIELVYGHQGSKIGTTYNAYGIKMTSKHMAGSIGNMYDIMLPAPDTGGTLTGTHWGIYQAGTSVNNYFAGEVRIGNTNLDIGSGYALQVDGGIYSSVLRLLAAQSASGGYFTNSGSGSVLHLNSSTSSNLKSVFRITNNSKDMTSKAQWNEIAPYLFESSSSSVYKYWTNTHIYSKATGNVATGTNKNSGWIRGLDIGTFAGGSEAGIGDGTGQDLSDLTSVMNAYGTYDGVGTIDSATGLYIAPYKNTGTIGTMYDIYLGDGSLTTGGGTLTGTHWGVYQKRTDTPNNFAGGIKLGGVSNATLDDYEEGYFDIGVLDHGTVADSSKGKYIKVGNKVTVWCQVDSGTDTTNAAILKLTGMPFAAVSPNTTGHGGVGAVSYTNSMGGNVISAVIEATTTTVFFSKLDATDLLFSDCTSTWYVRFTITYQTT